MTLNQQVRKSLKASVIEAVYLRCVEDWLKAHRARIEKAYIEASGPGKIVFRHKLVLIDVLLADIG